MIINTIGQTLVNQIKNICEVLDCSPEELLRSPKNSVEEYLPTNKNIGPMYSNEQLLDTIAYQDSVIAEQQNQINKMNEEVEECRKSGEITSELEHERDSIRMEQDSERMRAECFESENYNLRSENSEIKNELDMSKKKIEELEKKIQEVENERNSIETNNIMDKERELRIERDETSRLWDENMRLENENRRLTEEVDILRNSEIRQDDELKSVNRKLLKEIKDLENEHAKTAASLIKAEIEASNFRNQFYSVSTSSAAEICRLNDEIHNLLHILGMQKKNATETSYSQEQENQLSNSEDDEMDDSFETDTLEY